MARSIIAVDLGGTQIRAARFDAGLKLLRRENTLTRAERGPDYAIGRILDYIAQVMPADRGEVLGIGLSAPGPLNPATGVILSPPNLPGWDDIPLGEIIAAEFGLPVYIGNDANVAALAEASIGAARGKSHVVYITVSTGVGSGVICAGRLLLGRAGLAPELGHIPILVDGDRVSSVELEAAGPAIARRAVAALENGEPSRILDLVDGDIAAVDAKAVGQAAAMGDELARACLAHAGRVLGLGVVAALHVFNPEIVVIGGGVAKTGELLFAPMREAIKRHVLDEAYTDGLQIERADLGDDVALAGAAALVATAGGARDISELDRLF